MPLVSILMPARDAAATLALAIDSVRNQTFKDWELIIADDGSRDNSLSIAQAAAATDPRIRAVSLPPRGVYATLNTAASLATGTFLGQCDADDLLAPVAIAECTALLQADPALGVVFTDHLVLDASGKALGIGKRSQIPFSPHALLTDFISFHFRLIRRTAFDSVGGFDDSYQTAGDYDLCLRLSETTAFQRIPHPLYGYRKSPASISHARQLEQIESSARAIRAALHRRGLSSTLELNVEIQPRFTLLPKSS